MPNKTAQQLVDLFYEFIKDKNNSAEALKILVSNPYGSRGLRLNQLEDLRDEMRKYPWELTIGKLWNAYRALDNARVRGSNPEGSVTNIISLYSYVLGDVDLLEPFKDTTAKRFNQWIYGRETEGVKYDGEQFRWLASMKDFICERLTIALPDLDSDHFNKLGGRRQAEKAFSDTLPQLIEDINAALSN